MCDILFLQEHWLFSFDKHKINSLTNTHFCEAKSVDDNNDTETFTTGRGYGGVAVYWKKDLDNSVKCTTEGNERILVLNINTTTTPICIISVYMPSNNKCGDEEYIDTLAQLGELVDKYDNIGYKVLLCGDMNASLFRNDKIRHKRFQQFIQDNNLCLSKDYPRKETFYHHNGLYSSQIDYFVHKKHEDLNYQVKINDLDPLNVSDHTLITATIPVATKELKRREQGHKIMTKPNWSKCNMDVYQEKLRESIKNKNVHVLGNSTTEIENLTMLLHESGRASIPNYRKTAKVKQTGKGVWNSEIGNASRQSKQAFYQWKGDKTDNVKKQQKIKARKLLRSAQRRAQASIRNSLSAKIMSASETDTKLFHKLVQRQRSSKTTSTDTMIFNHLEHSDQDGILSGWKGYFNELYKCDHQELTKKFNTEKLDIVQSQNEMIEQLEIERNDEIPPTTAKEISQTLRKLKTGKSAGPDGISAEHLKNIPDELIPYIVSIINQIFKEKEVPEMLKEGILTPVHKKGKDKCYPANYRGITVTSIFSAIIECIIKNRIDPTLLATQSKLQRGFTENTSSLNAAFIVSETEQFYHETSQELVLVTLDAQKAFDKIHHEILFNKIYHDGITGNMWLLLRNMYRNVTVKVKWNGDLSENFTQEMGVRQGARLSTVLYKRYNNTVLNALERSTLGAKIGNINVVAPTCADDIALLAGSQHEMQALLDIVQDLTSKDLTTINPTKSELVPLTKIQNDYNVQLGTEKIGQRDDTKHLGIKRMKKRKVNTEERLQIARRTTYALLGPGLYSHKGMSPLVSAKLWKTYVLPRSLYGIEVLNYTATDIKKLETLQLKMCRQMQGLPSRAANIATYALLGTEPIEAALDKLLLTFFVGAIQDCTSIEYKIIERQLAMSENKPNSFISRLKNTLAKYELPSPQTLIVETPPKQKWKPTMRKALQTYWYQRWNEEKLSKSSLEYLEIKQNPLGNPHQIWKTVPNNPIEVKKAEVKSKLISKTYTLQSDRAKFSRNTESGICLCCRKNEENTTHFLLDCEALDSVREKYLNTLKAYMDNNLGEKTFETIKNENIMVNFILDCSTEKAKPYVQLKRNNISDIETMTRTLCYGLHTRRMSLLPKKTN